MKHRVFSRTDIGQQYKHNEDAHLLDEKLGLYIVCDGAGGRAAGEVASATACETIRDYLARRYADLQACRKKANLLHRQQALDLVTGAIRAANDRVHAMSRENADGDGMACTVALLLLLGSHAVVAHAGDSRVYLLRNGKIYQITDDHSAVVEQFKRGLITAEQARGSRHGSLITRALGAREFVEPDTLFVELVGRDRFLVCSDGLTAYLTDDELLDHFKKHEGQQLVDTMVDLANRRGGRDNITAVVATLGAADTAADERVAGKFEVLKKIPIFAHLKYLELMKVLNMTDLVFYKKGQSIITEGDADSRMFVMLAGAADVIKGGQVIAELSRGAFFGEMSLIDKAPRSADVVAAAPTSLIVMAREDFVKLVTREPHMALKLLWPMCVELNVRLRNTSDELALARNEAPSPADPTDTAAALRFLTER